MKFSDKLNSVLKLAEDEVAPMFTEGIGPLMIGFVFAGNLGVDAILLGNTVDGWVNIDDLDYEVSGDISSYVRGATAMKALLKLEKNMQKMVQENSISTTCENKVVEVDGKKYKLVAV